MAALCCIPVTEIRPLPEAFCWTRFGTEAGEPIESIIGRKNLERADNDGVFYWGIGNSVAPGVAELIREYEDPEVLFSPIKGRPRPIDEEPVAVASWGGGETLGGHQFSLPDTIRVTSKLSRDVPGRSHYALVCRASEPLVFGDHGRLRFASLRNLRSGHPLGASQVTAVVRVSDQPAPECAEYVVALRANLVFPYFVRLTRLRNRGATTAAAA
jgi:hypothetical protein